MTEETQSNQQEEIQKLYAFVAEQMKDGADKAVIIRNLIKMGVVENEAPALVDKIHAEITEAVKKEQLTNALIVSASLGGIIAAVICGVLWGLIVIITEYEIGFMAWAVGIVVGLSVVLFSGGKRGLPLQIIAVASSVLGIIIGKYLTFFYYLRVMVEEEHGEEAASSLSVLSGDVIQFFLENIISMSHPLDLLWIFFAIATAWRIPKGNGIKLQSEAPVLNLDDNQ